MNLFDILTSTSILIPLAVGLARFNKLAPDLQLVVYFVIMSACFSAIGVIIVYGLGQQNQWQSWLNTVMELAFIVYIYRNFLGNLLPQWAYPALVGSFVAVTGVMAIVDGIEGPAVVPRTIESVIVISLCLMYFYQVSRELKIQHLEKNSMFWVSTGFLLFFCTNLFFFILNDEILAAGEMAQSIYLYLYMIPMIFTHLFIAIGLWQNQS